MKGRVAIYRICAALLMLVGNVIAFAQPPAGPPPTAPPTGGGPPCWDPECIPIDGGVGFLIVAGAALGAKKIYDHRNKSRA